MKFFFIHNNFHNKYAFLMSTYFLSYQIRENEEKKANFFLNIYFLIKGKYHFQLFEKKIYFIFQNK
jgi:hypothetical protein